MIIKSDFCLKHERATGHLNDLNGQVLRWFEGNHYAVFHEKHPSRPNYFVSRIHIEPIEHGKLSLIIGDIIHNLRCTLDYLMYALASKYVKKFDKKLAQRCEFPIFGDKDGKGVAVMQQEMIGKTKPFFKGIPPRAKTIIKRLQPYRRKKAFHLDPLWVLYSLSNTDKHRLLIDAARYKVGVINLPTESVNIVPGSLKLTKIPDGIIEDQAEIATWTATPIDPDREMDVKLHPVINVLSSKRSGFEGKDMVATLEEISNHISRNIVIPLSAFL